MNALLRFAGWLRNEVDERRWWLLIVVVIAALVIANYGYDPVQKFENVFLEPVGNEIGFAPSGFQCPDGWSKTSGEDPERGEARVVSCTDGRIILTHREGEEPIAFDGETGQFVDASKYK